MRILRDRLMQANPELHAALERSWRIALDEWLGSIKPSQGSFNSYPHLRNLEIHLDQVILGIEQKPGKSSAKPLSPAELYVVLAAILFHDIGRAKNDRQHPLFSEAYIDAKYAHLGIPSPLLAKAIARVAREHGAKRQAGGPLPTVMIDPHGEIRQEHLAALLILVDHMDSAFTRVLPEYLVSDNELGIVGLFRRGVSGVVVDHEANMVKTAIGTLQSKKTTHPKYHVVNPIEFPEDYDALKSCGECKPEVHSGYRSIKKQTRCPVKLIHQALTDWMKDKKIVKRRQTKIRNRVAVATSRVFYCDDERQVPCASLYKLMKESLDEKGVQEPFNGFSDKDWLVVRKVLVAKKSENQLLPPASLLAVIMGDILANGRALRTIQSSLAAIGLPLGAWLMDFNGHLFNTWGQETYEPIFSERYLERVTKGMWDLSIGVFGSTLFSYQDVAGLIGESDAGKVRRAVRRISLVAYDAENTQGNHQQATWAGDSEWKWNVDKVGGKCVFVHAGEVLRLIENLGDPYEL